MLLDNRRERELISHVFRGSFYIGNIGRENVNGTVNGDCDRVFDG